MAVLALLGSGEFLPWARAVDGWCAERATAVSDRALVVPTACAPEGAATWDRWASMGIEHYRALGLTPEVVELRARDDASKPAIVDAVAGARIVFFSGGNPGYLARTVANTPFWDAVRAAVREGTALGGCSAGASFLGTRAPFVTDAGVEGWVDGVKLLTRAFVVPHFDALDGYQPGLQNTFLSNAPAATTRVGIDEDTALLGDGATWSVLGRGATWLSTDGSERLQRHPSGAVVDATLGLDL